jgi:hypothetical protein
MVDQPATGERGENPGDRADVDPGPAGDLVGAQLGPRRREFVEDGDRTLDRSDLAGGWPASSCHGTILLSLEMVLPYGQY